MSEVLTDFNDLALASGPDVLLQQLGKARPAAPLNNPAEWPDPLLYEANGKRVIRHDGGKLPEILDQFGLALAELNADLFVHAARLVRLYPAQGGNSGGIHRPKGALIVHPVDAAHLSELGTRAAVHERYDARSEKYKTIDCPRRVADAYLARGHWPEQPSLTGFVEAPTIDLDGRLLDQPGYDKETGLFLAFDHIPGYEPAPKKPSKADATAAADLLLDLIESFPCVDDADRAAVLAGIITALVRRSLPSAPMLAITAPTPGTGKTMLAETPSVIATGRRSSVLSLGHDDAEAEKRLGGMFLAADLSILLDNIERPLGGDLICQAITQPLLRLRPLGGSGMVSVPTHAMLLATGNNLSIVGDLKRRVMLVRLDAQVERPEQRTFARNHLEDVYARRGELIRAALTIPMAYLCAGAPAIDRLAPSGSFEQWDRMVRRPLVWLGLPDPLLASETLRDDDPELSTMRALFAAWRAVFKDKAVTVAEVVEAGMDRGPMSGSPVNADLFDSLQVACAEKPNARRLGSWLRYRQNRIVDGLRLVRAGMDSAAKVSKWKITG
jgi:putative DNA primase/helicase